MASSPWCAEVDGRLTALSAAGLSYSEIAASLNKEFGLGISRNAALGRAHRLDIAKDKPTVEPIRKVRPISRGRRVRKRRVVVQPTAATALEAQPRHVALHELDHYECRFPYGDANYTFCGNATEFGHPYCVTHMRLCYTPAGQRRSGVAP